MQARKTGSETSARLASLAGRALRHPTTLTAHEIQELAGAVLEQREPPTVPVEPAWAQHLRNMHLRRVPEEPK
jgi:hypothetical protein